MMAFQCQFSEEIRVDERVCEIDFVSLVQFFRSFQLNSYSKHDILETGFFTQNDSQI